MANVAELLESLGEVREANTHRKRAGFGNRTIELDQERLLQRQLREAHLRDAMDSIKDVVDEMVKVARPSAGEVRVIQGLAVRALQDYDREV